MEALRPFPFVHKHPLIKNGKLNFPCCVCSKVEPDEICYICSTSEEGCKNFCFCLECSKYAEEEEMLKLHNHLLKPTKRYGWECDICKKCTYSSGLSMCCETCNFDCCVYCFWKLDKPRIIH